MRAEAVQTGAVAVVFEVAGEGKHVRIRRDALGQQLGGDAAALRVILTDKAQAAAVRQVGVERDAGNAVVGKLPHLRFYGNVVEGAERDALCAPVDQLVEQGDGLAGNIGFTGAHTDFRVAAGQLDAGALDAARDLLAERTGPVGQKHTQLHGRVILRPVCGLTVRLARRKVSGFADRVEHTLAHIRAYIRTIIQYTVNGSARNACALRHGLYRGSFVHIDQHPSR